MLVPLRENNWKNIFAKMVESIFGCHVVPCFERHSLTVATSTVRHVKTILIAEASA